MPERETRRITRAKDLAALSLFTMANRHFLEMRRFEIALLNLLDINDNGYGGPISDAIGEPDPDFDAAFEAMGFVVEDDE